MRGIASNLLLPIGLSLFFRRQYSTIGSIPANLVNLVGKFIKVAPRESAPRYLEYAGNEISKVTRHHASDIGRYLKRVTGSESKWDPIRRIGRWFISPEVKGDHFIRTRVTAISFIRISGALGVFVNYVVDPRMSEEIRNRTDYQIVRLAFGNLMTLGLVELTVGWWGLNRLGLMISALSEIGIEVAEQRKNGDLRDIQPDRFLSAMLRTALFSIALSRGFFIARSARLKELTYEQFLARYGAKARELLPFKKLEEAYRASGNLAKPLPLETIHAALGKTLVERIGNLNQLRIHETFLERFSVSLSAMVSGYVFAAPIYAAEAIAKRVNYENYANARIQQMIFPVPLMQLTTEWFGDYTHPLSIIINKFVWFWIWGKGTYNLYPMYAGEEKQFESFARKLEKTPKERWAEVVSAEMRKKFGHVPGNLYTWEGIREGYVRSFLYTLGGEDQPWGLFISRFSPDFARSMDTPFTAEEHSMTSLLNHMTNPRHYRIDPKRVERVAEALASYVEERSLLTEEDHNRMIRENPSLFWEEWMVLRTIALMTALDRELGSPSFEKLRNNDYLRKVENSPEIKRYLKATRRIEDFEERFKACLRLLEEDAVRGWRRTIRA